MTDNEIIRALECCKSCMCKRCPRHGIDVPNKMLCHEALMYEALNLINRQKASAEKLINAVKYLNEQLSSARSEAIKEFAGRLRYVSTQTQSDAFSDRVVTVRDINHIEDELAN